MSHYGSERRRQLRELLWNARARIAPAGAGFPAGGRRRVPGLRREEVAELAGLSETWYIRFETGTARLSLRALNRLADALRLDRAERNELRRLALPELTDPSSLSSHAVREIRALRSFTSRADMASSLAELAGSARDAVRSAIPEVQFTSILERTPNGTWLHRSDRPDIEPVVNSVPVDDTLVGAATFHVVPNVVMIGSTDYRRVDHGYALGVTKKTELRSGFGVSIPIADRFVGCAFADPGHYPTVEKALFLQAVATTIALTAQGEELSQAEATTARHATHRLD